MSASRMAVLTEYLAKALVDSPGDVNVTEMVEGNRVNVHLDVAQPDLGKVIGRGGRIATSLRSLVKVAAVREDVRVTLDIGD